MFILFNNRFILVLSFSLLWDRLFIPLCALWVDARHYFHSSPQQIAISLPPFHFLQDAPCAKIIQKYPSHITYSGCQIGCVYISEERSRPLGYVALLLLTVLLKIFIRKNQGRLQKYKFKIFQGGGGSSIPLLIFIFKTFHKTSSYIYFHLCYNVK